MFEELSKTNNNGFISLIENLNINKYNISKDVIKIDLDKEIDSNEINLIATSLFLNYKVNKIEIYINGNKSIEKTRNILEK